jgi:hypothetical protein
MYRAYLSPFGAIRNPRRGETNTLRAKNFYMKNLVKGIENFP